MRSVKYFLLSALFTTLIAQPVPEPLWPANQVPLSQGSTPADVPEITAYLPQTKGHGAAVVIYPGGGYQNLAMDHEGKQIAEWLNQRGFAAFVVKYRLGPKYHHPVMLTDAQRAIRLVRSRAVQYGIRADRIGVWGFSAGGHLASTVSTHFDENTAPADDPTREVSNRPDFAVLAYPVISSDPAIYHGGSFRNLLGTNPDPALLHSLSNDTQVTAKTPPTFLFHTTDDAAVPVENAIRYFLALRKNKVSAEMHVYEHGRHGVGLAPKDPILKSWGDRLGDWLVQFTK